MHSVYTTIKRLYYLKNTQHSPVANSMQVQTKETIAGLNQQLMVYAVE